ncbi:twin-arginine translocase subunit TatB [Altererythrobacter luteolus]|uniref:Sec-independent protein translocase protein TatB n=1 Tax=Pontixanthobacter luteolus TaxID=295089 RepID=A0A6I4V2D6_9SPHN|nr:Sec-independent protein translocase protein TatB [Pontixanthobacter luteolus]MXP47236.1 twin-arginine translocase subunit TatB [Pontixanthobacter luteolus]
MFDIGALELLLIVVVAIIVIGPKDMPAALRVAGRWVGKIRRVSAQFRSGFDAMVREAEMEDMERKWKEQNERIMAETPQGEMRPLPSAENGGSEMQTHAESAASATAESRAESADVEAAAQVEADTETEQRSLPLNTPAPKD